MAYEPASVVEVRAWGKSVGAVSATGQGYEFQYAPSWVRGGIELSPLLMPLTTSRRRFSFPALNAETFYRLPPMLADALPDKFGNALVDAWLATQGVSRASITPLDRLAHLGTRGMGALEFVPDSWPASPHPTALDIAELVSEARAVVTGTIGSDKETGNALRQIISVGTSAGGGRAKAVVNITSKTGEIRPGQTMPGPDEEAWLLKFDGVGEDKQLGESQRYTRIEFACSLMARAAGITMTETRLLPEHNRAHFLTRRFDRIDGQRIHMQTLCGLNAVDFNLRETNAYEQLFTTAVQLGLGEEARVELFRRMVFNIAASNHDDHAKNHSFLLRKDGRWELSPAYDITFAHDSENMWLRQHLMSVNGAFAGITRTDILAVADRFAVPGAKRVITTVADALDSWSQFALEAALPANLASELAKHFVSLAR